MVAILRPHPQLADSRPLNEVQKIVADRLFPQVWSPKVDSYERYKFFREYLGIRIQDEENVPIVGVGIGGTETNPVLEFLSTFPKDTDVEMLLGKLNLPSVRSHVTECTLPATCARPSMGGDEIGHPVGDVGTFGCLVEDDSGQQFILSCNHVIADLNGGRRCVDETWEPGRSRQRIGVLHDFKGITFGGSIGNVIDAAISKPDPATDVVKGIRGLGPINGLLDPVPLETKVRKVGKETNLTDGMVFIRDLSFLVRFQNKQRALFEKQIAITSTKAGTTFAKNGDSGSVILDESNNAAGLLFAVDTPKDLTYANPISMVLGYFRVKVCTE